MLNFGLLSKSLSFTTLGARSGVDINVLDITTTSRKCFIETAGSYSIDSGEISLNGGAWGAGPVVASVDDFIQVRVTSSSDYSTSVEVVAIGPSAWTSTFTVTTMERPKLELVPDLVMLPDLEMN
jgi:hypothetical protein